MTSLSLSSEGAPSTEEQAGIENHTEHLSASSLSSSVPDGTSVSLEDKDNDKATTTTTTTTTEEESVNDKDEESDADSEKTAGTTATTGTQSTTQTAPPDGNADYLRHELYKRLREEPDLLNWLHISVTEGIFYWDLENPENEWMSPEFKKLFGYEVRVVSKFYPSSMDALVPVVDQCLLTVLVESFFCIVLVRTGNFRILLVPGKTRFLPKTRIVPWLPFMHTWGPNAYPTTRFYGIITRMVLPCGYDARVSPPLMKVEKSVSVSWDFIPMLPT